MTMSQQHLQLQLQHHYHQHQHQQQESKPFRNLLTVDGQMSAPIAYHQNIPDQSTQQFAPPFHVVGFAPGPVAASDGGGLGWNNNGSEMKRRRLKEEDFLDTNNNMNTNSQISSVDFFQTRSVSTGLGLSLDDRRIVSSGDSPVFSLLDNEIDRELQRQEAEMDRFIKVQGEQLRQSILKKVQANQLQTLTLAEERILQKLHEKEAEVEDINKKNTELEERMRQLTVEAGSWQHRAKYNESMITALKINLQQVFAQGRDSKEGCGDSEVDDTASCCNGGALDFQLAYKENKDMKELMTCRVCKVSEVCMLLLPCRHLCLCKDCESKLSFCPLCQSSKFIGMEVYM
ncbi:hypothetical protein IFM89_036183 [Coptis chinensis]|uniref:RING-type domain-containing protein n=1 Tax=Coptis chinensis TaxID=261450 RepID=A0A835MB21_9MAGN|nr:hypothetical protein IFM89_036183 [Coptis chinensis]